MKTARQADLLRGHLHRSGACAGHAAISYILGCTIALLLWSLTRYVPSKLIASLLLGLTPLIGPLGATSYRPNPESVRQGMVPSAACMTLILLTGIAGPLVDTFFFAASSTGARSSPPRR